MNVFGYLRDTRSVCAAAIALASLSGCASDMAIYEPPSTEPTSIVTFVNSSESQRGTFIAFEDATACTGRRYIRFDSENAIPAGNSRSTRVAAGSDFAFLASLNTVENENYAIELGVTGSGPEPVLSRRFAAIGCSSLVSFSVEPDKDYYIVLSGPVAAGACSVAVSEIYAEGMILPVKTQTRVSRETWERPKSYCKPLGSP